MATRRTVVLPVARPVVRPMAVRWPVRWLFQWPVRARLLALPVSGRPAKSRGPAGP